MQKDRIPKSPETFTGVHARRSVVYAAMIGTCNALARFVVPQQETVATPMPENWTATTTAPADVKVVELLDRQQMTAQSAQEQELDRLRRAVEEA